MLLFFSVARSASIGQVERAVEATDTPVALLGVDLCNDEVLLTDKLVDISPLALRMSSPFNAGYWLAAA